MRALAVLAFLTVVLFLSNLFCGSVSIPFETVLSALMGDDSVPRALRYIVVESRLPQAIVALLSGAGLAAAGLMLQTALRNPLAGPSILGVDAGASLGVAIVMLATGGVVTLGGVVISGFLPAVVAALVGAMAVMALLVFLSSILRSPVMLLIAGVMISYITSSCISLLNWLSTAEGVHSYVIWGLGNFGGVSTDHLPIYIIGIALGLLIAVMLIKPLNALLLGDRYAANLGVNIKRTRQLLLLSTGILVAITTSFCGPITFVGLAVPHLAQMTTKTSDHRTLMPATMLCGAAMCLLCNLISVLPGARGVIPINVITPMIGAPVVIYVIMKMRH